jgi:NAD(P)-dependent dehydrogenase (short-subunit alcohol dehydrogenase family)
MTTEKSILITGCSTGIGYEAAKQLKARGWRVIATARKAQDRARLERELGVETLTLELADMNSIAACAKAALAMTNNKLGALYNNAAYGQIGAMEDISGEVLRQHFDINVIGTHELTRLIIPAMRAAGGGRIVNCSSVLGLVSGPFRGPYCASKFALEAMTDAMRLELVGSGISVSLLEPGPIKSEFMATTLATFKANVDAEHSPHHAAYSQRLNAMATDTQSRFKLGPEAVVAKLIHALESPRPKSHYKISVHTHAISLAKRILPRWMIDTAMARS